MSYQFNTLQDCLDECSRIETARNNIISAMNSAGFTVPADASLGMIGHYFGCDSYIGPSLPTKTFASFADASTAISQVITKKNNLKNLINIYCAPKNIRITNEPIDNYYTYIANTGQKEFRVQYISNPSSSDYIDLGFKMNKSWKLSADISWHNLAGETSDTDYYASSYKNLMFGASEIIAPIEKPHPVGHWPFLVYGITGFNVTESFSSNKFVVYYWCTTMDAREYPLQRNYVLDKIIHEEYVDKKYSFYDCTAYLDWYDPSIMTTKKIVIDGAIDSSTLSHIETQIVTVTTDGPEANTYPLPSTNCMIFNNNGYLKPGARFYSGQIKNSSGTVIHNLLPYIEWSGCSWTPFVKDTVTNIKYYNSGPNVFNYGPIIIN